MATYPNAPAVYAEEVYLGHRNVETVRVDRRQYERTVAALAYAAELSHLLEGVALAPPAAEARKLLDQALQEVAR